MINIPKEYNPNLHLITLQLLTKTDTPEIDTYKEEKAYKVEALIQPADSGSLLLETKINHSAGIAERLKSRLDSDDRVPTAIASRTNPPNFRKCGSHPDDRVTLDLSSTEIINVKGPERGLKADSILPQVRLLRSDIQNFRSEISAFKTDFLTIMARSVTDAVQYQSELGSQEIIGLQKRLREEIDMRRKLHNTVQELKGNIRVYVRIRPLLQMEKDAGNFEAVEASSDQDLIVKRSGQRRDFIFDRVFSQQTNNGEFFNELQQLIISSLDGFNVAILAYGITGSGKTFTMEGIYERIGIDLFECKTTREHGGGWKYSFEISVFEDALTSTMQGRFNPASVTRIAFLALVSKTANFVTSVSPLK